MSVTIDNPSYKYSGKHQYDIFVYSGGTKCDCEIKTASFSKTKGSVNNPFARYASVTGTLTTEYTFTKGQEITVHFVICDEDGSNGFEYQAGDFIVYNISEGESDLKTYSLSNGGQYLAFQNKLKKLSNEEYNNIFRTYKVNDKFLSCRITSYQRENEPKVYTSAFSDIVNVLWAQKFGQSSTVDYDIPFTPHYYVLEKWEPYDFPADFSAEYSDISWEQYSFLDVINVIDSLQCNNISVKSESVVSKDTIYSNTRSVNGFQNKGVDYIGFKGSYSIHSKWLTEIETYALDISDAESSLISTGEKTYYYYLDDNGDAIQTTTQPDGNGLVIECPFRIGATWATGEGTSLTTEDFSNKLGDYLEKYKANIKTFLTTRKNIDLTVKQIKMPFDFDIYKNIGNGTITLLDYDVYSEYGDTDSTISVDDTFIADHTNFVMPTYQVQVDFDGALTMTVSSGDSWGSGNSSLTSGSAVIATSTSGKTMSADEINTRLSNLEEKLSDVKANSITTELLADAISSLFNSSKINGAIIKDSTITDSQIKDSTITGSKFVDGTITATQIADSTITGSKIADSTIEGAKLTESIFKDGKIQGGSIDGTTLTNIPYASMDSAFVSDLTTDKTFAETLEATVANLGFAHITEGQIDNATITWAKITDVEIEDAQIKSINGNKITNGSVIAKALSKDMVETVLGVKVYYSASEPEGTFNDGDLWYKTLTEDTYDPLNDVIYKYDAETSTWVNEEFSTSDSIFIANSITAQNIVAGSIGAAQITTQDISSDNGNSWINLHNGTFNYNNQLIFDGSKLTIGGYVKDSDIYTTDTTTIDGGKITTGSITALGSVTSGSLNIGNGTFVVDSSGNMTATSATVTGTISGSTITGSTFATASQTSGTYKGHLFKIYLDTIESYTALTDQKDVKTTISPANILLGTKTSGTYLPATEYDRDGITFYYSGEEQETINHSGSGYANCNGGFNAVTLYENGTSLAEKYLGISDNAVSATKATKDGSGNTITSTYLKLSGGTLTGTLISRAIRPSATNSYNLGTSSYYWNNIYGTTIYENGTSLTNKYKVKCSRYVYTSDSLASGVDVAIADSTIISNAGLSSKNVIAVVCDNARPLSTWSTIMLTYRNGTSTYLRTWNGSSTQKYEVTFQIFYTES